MPFNRPTLPDLITRTGNDLDSRLPGTDSKLRRANTKVLARVEAGVAHGLHGHLEWISRQIHAATADEERLIIDGEQLGIFRKSADFARGVITVTGVNGSVIPADTWWQRGDGVEYKSTAEAVIADGAAAVSVMAAETGSAGNADPGVTLTLFAAIEGVTPAATVDAAGLRFGADIEDLELFRSRVIQRKRRPPAGGNKYDYVAWARNVSGVADAWTVPCGQGPGSVDLLILADPEVMGSNIPSAELLADVAAYITDICPMNLAYFRALAPTPKALDLTLSVTPNTAAVKEAVEAELADLVARAAESEPRLKAAEVTIPLTQIDEAVSLAAGETDHDLTVPAADYTCTAYELPVLGVITWL